jgi:hypothetical protein
MKISDYISTEDVQQTCQALGIRDWSQLTETRITAEEAKIIQEVVGGEAQEISLEDFQKGLEVELEHGIMFPDANVTNNHPILTGRIVLAHLKEMLDYYQRLEVAELEGDMLKAFQAGKTEKLFSKFGLLLKARAVLTGNETSGQD